MLKRKSQIISALFIVCGLFSSYQAHAVLGGDAASTAVIGKSLPGTVKMAKRAVVQKASGSSTAPSSGATSDSLYTVQETDAPGTTVREFISPDGKVFAVAWRGIVEPDLSVLFGDSYAEYQAEQAKKQPSRERHESVNTTVLKVRRSGHVRDRRGVAYIPSLVPAGVDAGALE